MNLRTVTMVSGVIGGLCWSARLVVDLVAPVSVTATDALQWAGLVLLAVALAGLGADLVGRELWLRAIVAIALPLLVWSVLEVLHPAGDPEIIDGVFGVAMLAICSRRLLTRRRRRKERRVHGAHSR